MKQLCSCLLQREDRDYEQRGYPIWGWIGNTGVNVFWQPTCRDDPGVNTWRWLERDDWRERVE